MFNTLDNEQAVRVWHRAAKSTALQDLARVSSIIHSTAMKKLEYPC